jgi:hypothetical protein
MLKRFFPVLVVNALAASATPAFAGPFSVAVSARGANAASCGTVAAPCLTLQYAVNLVDPGGKIDILDSGDYGPLTITKSVNIVYEGTGFALVRPSAAGRSAVSIAAGATGVVRLRGLTIEGGGTGLDGVLFMTGARLEIADSAIRNFTRQGVTIAAPASSFSIRNTTISGAAYGVRARPTTGEMKGDVDGLRLIDNTQGGMLVENCVDVVIANSVAMNNRASPGVGFRATGATARMTLRDTTALDNLVGVSAAGGGVLRLSNTILVGNNTAAAKSTAGVIETFGDNIIRANSNDALTALTPVPNH